MRHCCGASRSASRRWHRLPWIRIASYHGCCPVITQGRDAVAAFPPAKPQITGRAGKLLAGDRLTSIGHGIGLTRPPLAAGRGRLCLNSIKITATRRIASLFHCESAVMRESDRAGAEGPICRMRHHRQGLRRERRCAVARPRHGKSRNDGCRGDRRRDDMCTSARWYHRDEIRHRRPSIVCVANCRPHAACRGDIPSMASCLTDVRRRSCRRRRVASTCG